MGFVTDQGGVWDLWWTLLSVLCFFHNWEPSVGRVRDARKAAFTIQPKRQLYKILQPTKIRNNEHLLVFYNCKGFLRKPLQL